MLTEKEINIQIGDIKDSKATIIGKVTGNLTINMQQSSDYQTLLANLEKARKRVAKYPNDIDEQRELETAQKQLDDFKRDVIKLADDITRIPINTERLRLAKQFFDQGNYKAARDTLDTKELGQDQNILLAEQQRLKEKQADLSQKLSNNANEYLLKARLTAIDYSLPDRIAQTSQLFELALKSDNSPDNIFAYAYFLQRNNQFKEAEKRYQEALTIQREQVKTNPAVYLPDLATTLNNLGNLVSADRGRRSEAKAFYQEALKIRRQLVHENPTMYLPDVAITLNNLGFFMSLDSSHRSEAETLYQEALKYYRQLLHDNPTMHLPYVAMTLNNLGILVSDDRGRRSEAEALYQEALKIRRQLAHDNPAVYLPDVATSLNNLGILAKADISRRSEAEALYQEALKIWRQLAQNNPAVHLPNVANTLYAFGLAYWGWNEPQKSLPLLQESAELIRPFAKQAPEVFGEKLVDILQQIEQIKHAKKQGGQSKSGGSWVM